MVWGGGVFTLYLYCRKHSVIPNWGNAYVRTNVFRKDEPFVCMVQFLTSAESADMVLVGTAEFVAIYVVVLFKRAGRYRERLQTHL